MKKLILVFLVCIMAVYTVAPSLEVFAANTDEPIIQNEQIQNEEPIIEAEEPIIEADRPEIKSETLEKCLRDEFYMQSNSSKGILYSLPSDFTNLCKIIETQKRDNVTYNNWEQKVLTFLVNGGVAVIAGRFTPTKLRTFIAGGVASLFISVPKSQDLYCTIQVRECQDSTGINRYLIVTYYSDSARTKQLYQHYTDA